MQNFPFMKSFSNAVCLLFTAFQWGSWPHCCIAKDQKGQARPLPQVTQPVSAGAGKQTQVCLDPNAVFLSLNHQLWTATNAVSFHPDLTQILHQREKAKSCWKELSFHHPSRYSDQINYRSDPQNSHLVISSDDQWLPLAVPSAPQSYPRAGLERELSPDELLLRLLFCFFLLRFRLVSFLAGHS